MPEQPPQGWSPNPIYNSVHAVAPTPLGAQAQALMSPLPPPPAPMPIPVPGAPMYMLPMPVPIPMPRPLRAHKRMPAAYGSPGPAQGFLPPGRFEHYVPSVRYQPAATDIDFDLDEEDDEFVLVEDKERVPKDSRVGKRARRVEPSFLLKGVKNMLSECHPYSIWDDAYRSTRSCFKAGTSAAHGRLPTRLPPAMADVSVSAPSLHCPFIANPQHSFSRGGRADSPTILSRLFLSAVRHVTPHDVVSQQCAKPRLRCSPSSDKLVAPLFGLMSPVADPRTVFNTLRPPDPNHALGVPPRKPPEWSMPGHSRPSWACQLNPLLVHHAAGVPLVHFDLRLPPSAITLLHGPGAPAPPSAADRAQHATWPALAELVIGAVADEPLFAPATALGLGVAAGFPWAVRMANPGGVTCGDVWAALADAVMLHVRPGEYAALSPARKEQVKLSYWARCASDLPVEEGAPPRPGPNDGCRRIDVLGTRIMFRGLEPAPGVDGSWVMFLGPP
jgi:hypothetical protein